MKLYNPFKFHLVQFSTGKFGVRKFAFILGYVYLDMQEKYTTFSSTLNPTWFGKENVIKYGMVDTKEQALEQLKKFNIAKDSFEIKAKAV